MLKPGYMAETMSRITGFHYVFKWGTSFNIFFNLCFFLLHCNIFRHEKTVKVHNWGYNHDNKECPLKIANFFKDYYFAKLNSSYRYTCVIGQQFVTWFFV